MPRQAAALGQVFFTAAGSITANRKLDPHALPRDYEEYLANRSSLDDILLVGSLPDRVLLEAGGQWVRHFLEAAMDLAETLLERKETPQPRTIADQVLLSVACRLADPADDELSDLYPGLKSDEDLDDDSEPMDEAVAKLLEDPHFLLIFPKYWALVLNRPFRLSEVAFDDAGCPSELHPKRWFEHVPRLWGDKNDRIALPEEVSEGPIELLGPVPRLIAPFLAAKDD